MKVSSPARWYNEKKERERVQKTQIGNAEIYSEG
jgi:hypothetical protein